MFLKRQSEIVVAVTVLLTAASAIIAACGGNIPPWYTSAKAAEDKRETASLNAKTVAALQRLSDRQDSMEKHEDQRDCGAMIANLDKAQAALRKNPDDPVALALAQSARAQMREIQGCSP